MKKIRNFLMMFTAIAVLSPLALSAQDRNNEDEVVKLDPSMHQRAYREGEVIVKFKPNKAMRVRKMKSGKFSSIGVNRVDNVLKALGAEKVDPLMPLTGKPEKNRKAVRSVSGKVIEDADMTQLYRVKFDAQKVKNVDKAIEKVKKLDEVEFAEPNYLVYSLAESETKAFGTVDPLLIQQWGPAAIGLPQLWKAPVINNKRPVIAILDTGVDTEHPDLKDNIWTNTEEQNGAAEADDDNNGFADDVHGWDFVNQTGEIGDWNGHGTHCAGIAGAVGDNGIGIKGANPDALIMPVTVMQSDGVGDVATIIKGIDYAAANGADVISMSFGGYAYSMAEEQALGKAYSKAVLVAAAGNDCLPINPDTQCPICRKWGAPMFPAAFNFVLGVEAYTELHRKAVFSNYDDDGPVFSKFEKLYNYELKAPGAGIMSTYPGGKYKAFNGTSMACPMVAGAISRLLQCKEYNSKEILFGDLIHSSGDIMNIYKAYQIKDEDRKPELHMINYELNDTIGGDGDLRADAGETIEFYPTFRNDWGIAKNVRFSLEMGELEDPSLITFENQNVEVGKPLSGYAKVKSQNPLRFTVNKKCVDGRHINLRLTATCDNIKKKLVQKFTITVENGVELGGMIHEDLTLYADKHYIVTKTLGIPQNIKFVVKPGTKIYFRNGADLKVEGDLICNGKPDSLITFIGQDIYSNMPTELDFSHFDTLTYVNFKGYSSIKNCHLRHCILDDKSDTYTEYYNQEYVQCNFINTIDCDFVGKQYPANISIATNCNIIGNKYTDFYYNYKMGPEYVSGCNIYGNWNDKLNKCINTFFYSANLTFFTPESPSYWGSSKKEIVQTSIVDMNYPGSGSYGEYDLSNMLTRPSAEAHGCVWKVVVNGYDAQDQFDELPPLGVGKQKFEVYFNRPMDTAYAPNIYMGVRPPYTQNTIAEDGFWSNDSTVYTAYLTITGKTATDGLNRIYVDGAKDTDHFEVPTEDSRFNVEVAAAGSMSTGLMATPGLGKVTLDWVTDEADFADLMGYNIMRTTDHVDSVYVEYDEQGNWVGQWKYFKDTITVNKQLLEPSDTTFVDYDVVPGETYYYTIKQMTTSLNSYSLSNPVAAIPLTATKGDANGSMNVDVNDVVTEISWLSNQNPQPFIFDAADVNTDQTVNILDVVGTINIIMSPAALENQIALDHAVAQYFVENGVLYVETPVALSGIQIALQADRNGEISAMDDLKGFERAGTWLDDHTYQFLAYSMSGRSLAPGRHALLRIGRTDSVKDMVLADPRAKGVWATDGDVTGIGKVETMQMEMPYPNPFTTVLNVPYAIGKEGVHDVTLTFFDVEGNVLHKYQNQCESGNYTYTWRPTRQLQPGMYLVNLYVDGKLMHTVKVICIH